MQTYYGEMHHNTYQYPEPNAQNPSLDEVLTHAAEYLDFYGAAYYTPSMVHTPLKPEVIEVHPEAKGFGLEYWKDADRIAREWPKVTAATAAHNVPGEFVTFPGYEWQGDGSWGDHNVFGLNEGLGVYRVDTLAELYDCLRKTDAIAVPHHTGYLTRRRSPDWAVCDERLSPFAEMYSRHGCSEADNAAQPMRRTVSMGPRVSGSTYADALDRGLHIGAIASTDNWANVPACYDEGLMGCLATELTREALWEAFLARRVFAMTGDRMALDFTVNGALMGERIAAAGARKIRVAVRGADEIDRIELLRDNRVVATQCHRGTWDVPAGQSLWKLRIEAGWGAKFGTLPIGEREWRGELRVANGRVRGFESYRISHGHGVPELHGDTARFRLVSQQKDGEAPVKNAFVFEFEADATADLTVRLNGLEATCSVAEACRGSRLLWYREESIARLREMTELDVDGLPRLDPAFTMAHKALLHRVAPEAAYTAELTLDDDAPLSGESHYRVRVQQSNGQMAWSSPIWVRPE